MSVIIIIDYYLLLLSYSHYMYIYHYILLIKNIIINSYHSDDHIDGNYNFIINVMIITAIIIRLSSCDNTIDSIDIFWCFFHKNYG